MTLISNSIIPLVVLFAILYSLKKKTNAYSSFIKGVLEGIDLFKEVFPSVLAMYFGVSLLIGSGLLDDFSFFLGQYFSYSDSISKMLPLLVMKPVSDSASFAVLESICREDADSFNCRMASTIHASAENTFFVLALYFTSIGVTKWKHALKVGLIADVVGIVVAITLSIIFLR